MHENQDRAEHIQSWSRYDIDACVDRQDSLSWVAGFAFKFYGLMQSDMRDKASIENYDWKNVRKRGIGSIFFEKLFFSKYTFSGDQK